nr:hypothetical protein [Tanacetum cinerariifolium]
MDVRVLPVRSPRLSAGIAEVATMLDSAFRKRFRYSYDSSPSPTLPVRKRYRGTSELIFSTDSDEIDESLDSDSESEDAKDKGPTAEDEDDESRGLDDEGLGIESDGLGLGEEDAVPEGQQQAAPVVRTTVSTPLGLGSLEHEQERIAITFGALWRPILAWEAWAGRVDTRMIDMSWAGYDDHRLVHDMLL